MDVEDEKKVFDAEAGNEREDGQPDPDEQLMLDQGGGRVWLVKIPKHLLERWQAVVEEDVQLATIRVYQNSGGRPRILLFLPPNRDPGAPAVPPPPTDHRRPRFDAYAKYTTAADEPDCYDLDIVNDNVQNQIVVAERPKIPNSQSRARTTILTGRIKHDCNLRPSFSAKYRKHMRERHKLYNTPTRQIKSMDDEIEGGRGALNRLASGVANSSRTFSDLVKTKKQPRKGEFERMARIPKNDLLDMLFDLFKEQPRWSVKVLRERTQQPEAYLKEVLGEIAALHRSGEFNGLWELTKAFRAEGIKPEGESSSAPSLLKQEDDIQMASPGKGDDDDDEDEDMEEVS